MDLKSFFYGALIGSKFHQSSSGANWENRNPYRWDEIYFHWKEDLSLVSEAVRCAQNAFPSWSSLPLEKRSEKLRDLAQLFVENEENIAMLIALETGKAIWEANGEAKALSSKVRVTLETLLPAMQQLAEVGFIKDKQWMEWKARGICSVLGPFNFPLHLANGHIIPALLAGNVVIYKGSEFAPTCGSFYASLFKKAGFPAGVFQYLPGGAETGKALVENENVKGVFFTGSYQNGRRITESLLRTRQDLDTIAALELGGKNACIIHKDAVLEKAIAESLLSAFATAGQRCSCSSRIFVHSSLLGRFKSKFVEAARKLRFGDPLNETTFAGPMIHMQAVESFKKCLEKAKSEGLRSLLESEQKDFNSCVISPSVYEATNPEVDTIKDSLKEEFFGPHCVLIPYSDEDKLIEWHERAPYALVTSVFSEDEQFISKLDSSLEVGLFNINRATVGASSQLPFGGRKKSGNNWPAGIFSYFYCASPRSYLRDDAEYKLSSFPQTLAPALEGLG